LKDRGFHINNLQKDLCDGVLLVNLLEIISGKSLGRYNRHARIPPQKLENNALALKFLESEGIKLVNIGPEDITDGRLKLTLGLLWTIILRYQINKSGSGENTAKDDLLRWVQSKIPEYNIKNFTKDWNDGRAICGLVNALKPGLCPDHLQLNPNNALGNASRGIDQGFTSLGVPKIVQPQEMIHPKVDEHAMMTYISCYRDLEQRGLLGGDEASRCQAYGQGLTEAIVNQPAEFVVETPRGCKGKLEVKVEGPKSKAQVNIRDNGDGTYNVSYKPTEPGNYLVHVTLDKKHIPGSIFHVVVLAQESLGGEGKILVFYTTTSSSNEKSRPLQELLESKQVHLRADFEPWIPVDIMEKEDREAVFRRAGTRKLPIVFIDDVYVGDYQRVAELNQSGELDRMLKVNEAKYIESGLQHLSLKKNISTPKASVKTTTGNTVSSTSVKSTPTKTSYR
jgi:glutaredoxin